MTATGWFGRVVCALLAIALLVGALVAIVEIAAAAAGRSPWLVPHREWADWLRTHSWNHWIVNAVFIGLIVLGLILLFLAIRRGKPTALTLRSKHPGVSRRSVEKVLANAALRTTGVSSASATVGRRTARVKARTSTRSEQNLHTEVESAVQARLDSLGLERPMRTRVQLATKDQS
jgi:hypothetical protein